MYKTKWEYKNPYMNDMKYNSDADLVNLMAHTIQDTYLNIDDKRGMLDRTFDALSTPLYVTAGAVRGAIDKDQTILGNVIGGLRAGNPFGKGYEKGEHTYSKVLESAGWKPETTLGKIAKGTLGFVGDIFLDPTTYLSGGASALVKGTGKAGLVANQSKKLNDVAKGLGILSDVKKMGTEEAIEAIAKATRDKTIKSYVGKNVNPELIERLATKKSNDIAYDLMYAGKEMDKYTAQSIISSNAKKRGITLSEEELLRDADKLTETYNRIAGANRKTSDLTFGLGNAPFGKKLFGKYADKSVTLAKGEDIAKFSDKFIAPQYAKLRDSIYGSKLGNLFSSKSALYKASKEDPARVYDFLKFTEHTRGLTKDMLEAEKLIRSKAKNMKFSEAETKQILELMQDKSIWNKVTNTVKFLDTKEAQNFKSKTLKRQGEINDELNALMEVKNNIETLKHATDSELFDTKEVLDTLTSEHRQNLLNLDTTKLSKSEDIQKALKMYEDELSEIESARSFAERVTTDNSVASVVDRVDDYTDVLKTVDEYKEGIKQRGLQKENHKVLHNVLEGESPREALQNLNLADEVKKPGVTDRTYNKIMKSLNENGYVSYKSTKSIKNFENLHPTWEKVEVKVGSHKEVRFMPPQNVMKKVKELSVLDPSVYNSLDNIDKPAVVQKISEHLYDDPKMISSSTWDKHIDAVADMMRDNVSKEKILQYIEKNAKFFNGKAQEVYPFVAKQVGYGNGTSFASWEDFYTKPMEELYEKSVNGTLTVHDERKMLQLQKKKLEREYWLKMFDEADNVDEVLKIIQDVTDKQYEEWFYSNQHMLNTTSKGGVKTNEDVLRGKFIDDASASDKMKYQEFIEKEVLADSLDPAIQREEYLTEIFDRINSTSLKNPKLGAMDKAGEGAVRWASKVADEVDPLLESHFGKPYSQLSDGQKNLLYKMAMTNANAKMQGGKLVGGVTESMAKAIVKEATKRTKKLTEEEGVHAILDILGEGTDEVVEKAVDNVDDVVKNVDEVIEKSEITVDMINRQEELNALIEESKSALKLLDDEYSTSYHKTLEDFTKSTDELKTKIGELEETQKTFNDILANDGDLAKIDELRDKSKMIEDALSSDDALETFIKSKFLNDDAGKIESILFKNTPDVGKIVLDTRTDVSDKVKNIVKVLRGEFIEIGKTEVAIGKLKQEQFDNLMFDYVSHILTAEGERLFASNKEIAKKIPGFGDDLGYGRKFNPYSKSRTIKFLPDGNGGFIENPTIEQINEFFKPMTQGKNVMSENIADIYLTRALKNTELLYDHKYTQGMMDIFGKQLPKGSQVEEGYKAVINYGQLKDTVQQKAKLLANLELQQIKSQGGKIAEGQFAEVFQNKILTVLDEFGLDAKTLDDMATPMIELSDEQIASIQKLKPNLIKQVNDAIVQKANQSRKLQMFKDQKRFLQIYDKFTHFVKLNQTTVLPSFHLRNKMSNTFQNWLAVGVDAFNPELQVQAFKTMKNQGNFGGAIKITKADGSVSAMTWSDLYENAKKYGVIDEGYFAKDVGAGASSTGKIKKLQPKFDPTDTKNFVLYKKGSEYGSLIENQDRLIQFASHIKNGKSVEEATELVNKYLFDYSDLTAFEANVMKRIFPYYTWLRKNASLQLKVLLENPKKFQYVSKVLGGIEGMVNEEDKINKAFVNDFAKDWVQTPFSVTNPEGRKEPVLWNPNLPFMDLNRIPNPLDPVGSIKSAFTQMNPLIKTPAEQIANQNVFFEQPIVEEGDNELAKRAHHVASQFGLYSTLGDFVKKDGADLGLHAMNTATGLKMLSYDYDKYKAMKIQEILNKDKKK